MTVCLRSLRVIYADDDRKAIEVNNELFLNVKHIAKFPDNALEIFLESLQKVKNNNTTEILLANYNQYMDNIEMLFDILELLTNNCKPKNKLKTFDDLVNFLNIKFDMTRKLLSVGIILNYIDVHNIKECNISNDFKCEINELLVDLSDDKRIKIKDVKKFIKTLLPNIFNVTC